MTYILLIYVYFVKITKINLAVRVPHRGVFGLLTKTLTLFMAKLCDFLGPIYDLTKNSISCFWPDRVALNIICEGLLLMVLSIMIISGGSRGAPPPLFWVKKKKITEGRKASRASKSIPPPPPPSSKIRNWWCHFVLNNISNGRLDWKNKKTFICTLTFSSPRFTT